MHLNPREKAIAEVGNKAPPIIIRANPITKQARRIDKLNGACTFLGSEDGHLFCRPLLRSGHHHHRRRACKYRARLKDGPRVA